MAKIAATSSIAFGEKKSFGRTQQRNYVYSFAPLASTVEQDQMVNNASSSDFFVFPF